jgi:hypothetical protein
MKSSPYKFWLATLFVFAGIAGAGAQSAVTLSAGRTSGAVGSSVCVNVSVGGFRKIISMQYSMKWDPQVLELTGVKDFRLPFLNQENFGLSKAKAGQLTFVWIDNNLKGITLPDGSPVFQLCFRVKGKAGTAGAISFSNQPTPYEVVNVYEQLLQLVGIKGEIKVK